MAIQVGDKVVDPRRSTKGRRGLVLQIRTNPACLMRSVIIRWVDTGVEEELDEIEFGALED